jgi:hypothetical protein
MNKLQSLRDHLLTGPIEIDADDLLTFADEGQIISNASGTNDHYEFNYKANVIITNFSGHADQLAFWVLQWLKIAQPDHRPEAVQFEADVLGEKSVDLSLSLNLTETIKVSADANGDILLHHADEPNIDPVLLPATEWTLYANDDPIETWLQNG